MFERPVPLLLLILLLLALSAFFSGSETALMAVRRMRVKHLAREGHKAAVLVEKLLQQTDRLLGTILVGNNLVNVAASVLGGALAARLLAPRFGPETAVAAATLVMTLLLLIVAEITPKTLAAHYAEEVSFAVARPIRWLTLLLSPLVAAATGLANLFLRKVLRVRSRGVRISPEEIRSIIAYGEEEGVLDKEKKEMLHGVFDMSRTLVREVMVPRPDIVALEISEPPDRIIETVVASGHSRYPVYREEIDRIAGFLFVKDLLPHLHRGTADLRRLLRPPAFVPETKRVDELLAEFRAQKRQISLVADEYGAVAGLVTMEDLLEEITGEIRDEYDREAPRVERLPRGGWIVQAGLPLEEVAEATGIDLPPGDYETLAGFLLDVFGKIPGKGESIAFGAHRFTVTALDRHRIVTVRITPLAPGRDEAEP